MGDVALTEEGLPHCDWGPCKRGTWDADVVGAAREGAGRWSATEKPPALETPRPSALASLCSSWSVGVLAPQQATSGHGWLLRP